jgi:hypothetical protein
LLRGRGLYFSGGRESVVPAFRRALPVFRHGFRGFLPVFAGFPAAAGRLSRFS